MSWCRNKCPIFNSNGMCYDNIKDEFKECKPKTYRCMFYTLYLEEELKKVRKQNRKLVDIINNTLDFCSDVATDIDNRPKTVIDFATNIQYNIGCMLKRKN